MSDLFDKHTEITQEECEAYARELTNSTVTAVSWQGAHSYTLLTGSNVIVQFRSKDSPLDIKTTELAKFTHPHLAPKTTYHGLMTSSSVTVWIMEALPGRGYLYSLNKLSQDQLELTVSGMASFYAEAWKKAHPLVDGTIDDFRAKLEILHRTMSARYTPVVERLQKDMDQAISQMPWVLTHQDLASMNMLVDTDTGRLTGIADWVDADIEPFGMALWGLEDILGSSGPDGWSWVGDTAPLRSVFREAFFAEIGERLSDEKCIAIDQVRDLGLLLRWGFMWSEADGARMPVEESHYLDAFLGTNLLSSH